MKISACIIAKNEEDNLPRLLKSLKGKFDEIILVDTGSTDRTVEIAKEFGCKVYYREWNGFADARNYAISKASGDWIWHFDADFEIDDEEFKKAKQHLLILDERFNSAAVIIENYNIDGIIRSYSSHTFIHRNKPEIKWVGKVHEKIKNGEKKFGLNVKVKHFGYETDEILIEKAKRNISLLEEEIKELEKDKNFSELACKYFYLAQAYSVLGKGKNYKEKVIEVVEKYFSLKSELDSLNIFDIHIHTYLLNALISLGKFDECKIYLEKAISLRDDYPDFYYYKGKLFEEIGIFDVAFKGYAEFLFYVDGLFGKSPFKNYSGLTVLSDKVFYSYNISVRKLSEIFLKLRDKNEGLSYIDKLWKERKGLYTGIAYSKLLNLEKKKPDKILKKLMRIYADNYIVFFEYGNFLLDRGDISGAKEVFEKVVSLNKEFMLGRLFLLYTMVLKGELEVSVLIDFISKLKEKYENTQNSYFLHILSKCMDILNLIRNQD